MDIGTRVQGFMNLYQKYRTVFSHAWNCRHEMTGNVYKIEEANFLPAALALQESPVSPVPRVVAALLCVFAAITILWASIGQIDIVASAQGKIIPGDRTKTIQSLDAALVKAIYVREGQSVKAGQLLIELDSTMPTADRTRTAGDLLQARLQSLRAVALLESMQTGNPARISAATDVDPIRLSDAQRWVDSQHAEFVAKSARIRADIERRKAELRSMEELVRALERITPLEQQRARDFKELVELDLVSKHAYLEREQARLDKEGSLANYQGKLSEIHAGILEGKSALEALRAEAYRGALDSYNDAEQRIAELSQEMIKAEARSGQMRLVSPVDGAVQELVVHTVGGVVTPAQPLMLVVPEDQQVEVEAFLENKDVGFVQPGDEAEVKVETFQYTKYGTIPARVTHVSHDAIIDEQKGLIYSIRVKLNRGEMEVGERTVKVAPGMATTVEIKTGKRRVIEYFLGPLLQYQSESLKER